MRLCHFTALRALIGDAGLGVMRPGVVDLAAIAAPGSIIADGLKPSKEDGYDHILRSPLPPCVWLTSDPDLGLKTHMGDHFSRHSDFRLTVLIPSTDRRLAHWPKYFSKHGRCTWTETMRQSDLPPVAQRSIETFYTYFGEINRITAVSRAEDKAQ
jgi:hypothetical protein